MYTIRKATRSLTGLSNGHSEACSRTVLHRGLQLVLEYGPPGSIEIPARLRRPVNL